VDAAGGDADFRAEAEFAAVAELGGGVPEADRAADRARKCSAAASSAVTIASVCSLPWAAIWASASSTPSTIFTFSTGIEPFGVEILRRGGGQGGDDGAGAASARKVQPSAARSAISKAADRGDGGVDQQRFGRAANAGAAHFGVARMLRAMAKSAAAWM
jgi:hypothetical protein